MSLILPADASIHLHTQGHRHSDTHSSSERNALYQSDEIDLLFELTQGQSENRAERETMSDTQFMIAKRAGLFAFRY